MNSKKNKVFQRTHPRIDELKRRKKAEKRFYAAEAMMEEDERREALEEDSRLRNRTLDLGQ